MEFLELRQALDGCFFPVLVLFGNDAWLKSRSLFLINQSLDIQNREMNVITLEKPQNFLDISSAIETDCFFSNQKLVVVEDFAFPQDKTQIEVKTKLSKFAKSGQSFCCLVFVDSNGTKFANIDGVTMVDCNHLSSRDTSKWILSYCKSQGKVISDGAATTLAAFCLNDMSRISIEAQKLCAATTGEISVELVESLVKKDVEFVVFDLGKAIAQKRHNKVFETVNGLLSSGEDVRGIFVVLYNFFRRLYYIKISKISTENLAKNLGVKSAAVGFLKESAQRFRAVELKKALGYFRECDTMLKQFFQATDCLNLLISKLLAL